MTLKILNLYAGIGGNRKLWSGDIHVTAVELDPQIAAEYQKIFPDDIVIVADRVKFHGYNTKGIYVTNKAGQCGSMFVIFAPGVTPKIITCKNPTKNV